MIIDDTGNNYQSIKYKDEKELQSLINSHPELLAVDSSNSELKSVGEEIDTEAGKVDVLLVDNSGKLVVVEVKLAKNGDSRRKVVSQIIDYVSALSNYSYYDLDNEIGSRLSNTVKKLPNFDSLIPRIDECIRSGKSRLVIAMDEANKDLLRIVQFLSNYTDFEIDIVEIKKYIIDRKEYYSSNIIFKGKENLSTDQQKRTEYSYELINRINEKWDEEYGKKYPTIFKQKTPQHYRQIRFEGWPSCFHYEFLKNSFNSYVEVRLDIESIANSTLRSSMHDTMSKFEGKNIGGYSLELHQTQGTIRLIARINEEDALSKACQVMSELIDTTFDDIDGVIRGK